MKFFRLRMLDYEGRYIGERYVNPLRINDLTFDKDSKRVYINYGRHSGFITDEPIEDLLQRLSEV